jgi:YHS domain-containing protein
MEKLSSGSEAVSKIMVDPVCGMKVSTKKAGMVSDYRGMTYYFCAKSCRKAFEKNPQSYLSGSPRRKGVWGRYLDRLEKATGNRPIKCH